MEKKLNLPPLPAVPTAPMTTVEKRDLMAAMRQVPKEELWRTDVQEWVQQCYARIWINLCLVRKIQPPKASSHTHRAHRDILPAFCKAVGVIGLHLPEVVPDYHAPAVAVKASELWKKAMNAVPGGAPTGPSPRTPAAGAQALRSGKALPALYSQQSLPGVQEPHPYAGGGV